MWVCVVVYPVWFSVLTFLPRHPTSHYLSTAHYRHIEPECLKGKSGMWLGMQRAAAAAAVWVPPGCMRSFSALNVGRHMCSFYCVSLTESQGKYLFYQLRFLECVPTDCVRAAIAQKNLLWHPQTGFSVVRGPRGCKNSPFPNPSKGLMADYVAAF